jgi:hypothetical protein
MGDCGVALGEGSGFVDDEEFDLGEFFERGGVSDEDAKACGAGESACGGDGGGEAEGAGAGGDEDGNGPIDCGSGCFSSEDPSDGGGNGEKDDEGSEDGRDFVSDALERWGIFAGFVDESGEASDEGVVACFFGENEESASGDQSSSEDGIADKLFDREGFTGEDGFLYGGVAFENFSVGGNGFSWEDDEVVPRLNFGPGDNFFGALRDESSGWWGKGEEIFQRLGEFRFGALFDPLTCENEGGDGGGSIEKQWCMCFSINY